MGKTRKLTERQRRQRESEERQRRFTDQQQSIDLLSRLPQTKATALEEAQLRGPQKANNGLHLAAEHTVITRDMPDPWKDRFDSRLQEPYNPGLGSPKMDGGSKVRSRKDSEDLAQYSKKERFKEFSGERSYEGDGRKSSQSITHKRKRNQGSIESFSSRERSEKFKSPGAIEPGGQAQPSPAKTKGRFISPEASPQKSRMGGSTQTKHGNKKEDVLQRMQTHVINKERMKNQITSDNKDLQMAQSPGRKRQGRTTGVLFKDQMEASQYNSQQSQDSQDQSKYQARKTAGILKSQKANTDQIDETDQGEEQSPTDQQRQLRNKSPFGESRNLSGGSAEEDDGRSSIASSQKEFAPKGRDKLGDTTKSGKSLKGKKRKGKKHREASPANDSKADDVGKYVSTLVNHKRQPPNNAVETTTTWNLLEPRSGTASKSGKESNQSGKRKSKSDKSKGKSSGAGAQESYMDQWREDMNRRMLHIVYQYTRQHQDKALTERQINQSVDYSGKEYLEDLNARQKQRRAEQQSSSSKLKPLGAGSLHHHGDKEMNGDKRYQSDVHAAIVKRTLDRDKLKYEETAIYKNITDKLTYRNEVFESKIDEVLHPKNSPLPPAYIQHEKEGRGDDGKAPDDPYEIEDAGSLPEVEKFTKVMGANIQATRQEHRNAPPVYDARYGAVLAKLKQYQQRQTEIMGLLAKNKKTGELGSERKPADSSSAYDKLYGLKESFDLIIEEMEASEQQVARHRNSSGGLPTGVDAEGNVSLDGNALAALLPVKKGAKRFAMPHEALAALDKTISDYQNTYTNMNRDLSSSENENASPTGRKFADMRQSFEDNDENEVDRMVGGEDSDHEQTRLRHSDTGLSDKPQNGANSLAKPRKEQAQYSIVLNPKSKKVREYEDPNKIVDGEDKEAQKRESQQADEQKKQMMQADKVFKLIHEYCQENLSVGYSDLDKHIEDLLEPGCTVSPLLKYFNDLAKYCYFRLPVRSVLKFDQKFFKKYVQRLREAQKVEVKWVRKAVVNESRDTLSRAFSEARTLMQEEIKHVLHIFDELKTKLAKQERDNAKLQQKLVATEVIVKEQHAFINACTSRIHREDEDLYKLNGGPGGAYDKQLMNYGHVLTNIDAYHAALKSQVQIEVQELVEKAHNRSVENLGGLIKSRMHESISLRFNKPPPPKAGASVANPAAADRMNAASGLTNTKEDPNSSMPNSRIEESKAIQSLVSKQEGDDYSQNSSAGLTRLSPPPPDNMPTLDYEDFVPKKEECVVRLEPYFKQPLQLFGGQIKMQVQDIQWVMSQEVYKFHKIELSKLREKNEVLQSEIFANKTLLDQIRDFNAQLQKDNDDSKKQLKDMRDDCDEELADVKAAAQREIRAIQHQSESEIERALGLLTLEIDVCTAIKDKIIGERDWQQERLKKFATMLHIPRLHFDFILTNGIDKFVDKCQDIIKRDKALHEFSEAKKMQVDLRKDFSVFNVKRFGAGSNAVEAAEKMQIQKRDVKLLKPFRVDFPMDIRRSDHEYQQKPSSDENKEQRENEKTLAKLKKTSWLKDQSMLDLSELIRKHKDRQPELIAILQPDVKRELLHNPGVLKSLEVLERGDPINKRIAEIKNFIQSIKAQQYADKIFFKRDDRDFIARANQNKLSQSVVLDRDFSQRFKTIEHSERGSSTTNETKQKRRTPKLPATSLEQNTFRGDDDGVVIQSSHQRSEMLFDDMKKNYGRRRNQRVFQSVDFSQERKANNIFAQNQANKVNVSNREILRLNELSEISKDYTDQHPSTIDFDRLPKVSGLQSNHIGTSLAQQETPPNTGLGAIPNKQDQKMQSQAAIFARYNAVQRNAMSTKLIGLSSSGNFGLLGPGIVGGSKNHETKLSNKLRKLGSPNDQIAESDMNQTGESPSYNKGNDSFLPQINLDDTINISNSNIVLREAGDELIAGRRGQSHAKHADSITNITAQSGSKISKPFYQLDSNNISRAGLKNALSPNAASGVQLSSLRESDARGLPQLTMNSLGSLQSAGIENQDKMNKRY